MKSAAMDSQALIMELHGRALRLTAAHSGVHVQGLSHASRFLKGLSTTSRRRLIHIDIAYNLIRHITSPYANDFIQNLEQELSGRDQNSGDHKDKEGDSSRSGQRKPPSRRPNLIQGLLRRAALRGTAKR